MAEPGATPPAYGFQRSARLINHAGLHLLPWKSYANSRNFCSILITVTAILIDPKWLSCNRHGAESRRGTSIFRNAVRNGAVA